MTRRFFDHNPDTGITEYFHASEDGDSFQIEEVQDITALVELNKARYNEFTSARDTFGDGAELTGRSHVASIPPIIYNRLIREGILGDQKRMRAWLNDPDNRVFRTRPGVI